MKYFVMTLALVAMAFVSSNAADKEFKANCPVSGAAAAKESVAMFEGGKVYFCCGNCPKAFAKDTKKHAAKARAQMVSTGEMVQVACPFTGKAVDSATATKVGDIDVCFCCAGCKGKVDKAEDKVACVFTNAAKGFTTQTKCPISGKAIKAEVSVDYKGEKVYFCCPGCPAAFNADPEKFEGKLPRFSSK